MSLKCKLGFHSWNGCKCADCSKTRDEQHDWTEDCEKCSNCGKNRENMHDWSKDCEKCSKCGKNINNKHNWIGCKCSKCGNVRDEEHDWSSDCGKCAKCGKIRTGKHSWKGCECSICRTKRKKYSIGDKGPGGGIVFHVDNSGFNGLEAWPKIESGSMDWPKAFDYGERLGRIHGLGWRLPTIEELKILYEQRKVVGGFDRSYFHWSSDEFNSSRAFCLIDKTGEIYTLRKLGDALFVRLIRAFGTGDDGQVVTYGNTVRVEPNEWITWSDSWRYNYDAKFTEQEKNEIMESVKTAELIPHPTTLTGVTMENTRFIVFVYFKNGVWEINGATKK